MELKIGLPLAPGANAVVAGQSHPRNDGKYQWLYVQRIIAPEHSL
jgi:hypothetical protein